MKSRIHQITLWTRVKRLAHARGASVEASRGGFFLFMALTAMVHFSTALIAHAGGNVVIQEVEWRRTHAKDLVAILHLSETPDANRVRILLDVDGPEQGGAEMGADYMVEGPHFYRYTGGGGWSWDRLGEADSVVASNRLMVRMGPLPEMETIRAVVEWTAEDWSVQSRHPAQGEVAFRPALLDETDWNRLTLAHRTPALVIQEVEPFQTSTGQIGFRVEVVGQADISRIRILLDVDGPETGWPDEGMDLMMEGGLMFAYPEGETAWRWNALGGAHASAHAHTAVVVLPFIPSAESFRWYAESFDPAWTVVDRYPREGVASAMVEALESAPDIEGAPAPDMTEFLRHMPVSLSKRFQSDYLDRLWEDPTFAPTPPRFPVPGLSDSAHVFLEFTDAATGERSSFRFDRAQVSGPYTRWSGQLDDHTRWMLIQEPSENGDISVIGAVHSTQDRCFRLSVGIDFPEDTWTWHDDMQYRFLMQRGMRYAHDWPSVYGIEQRRSYYPFAVLSSPTAVLVAETDGREPRQFYMDSYGGENRVSIHYDMAATPLTEHFPGWAIFRARFRAEPRTATDPFRAALQTFYERDPDWLEARVPEHGLWMPFTDISSVAGFEDFHFVFFEKVGQLGGDVDAAHAAGALTFPYTEPWLYWLPLHDPAQWNHDDAVKRMEELTRIGFGQERDFASAGMLGASHGADLKPRITFLHTPWSDGARMEMNTDPELPVTEQFPVNRAMAEWRYIKSVVDDPRVDGIYLDSMSAMETIDYNPRAISVADYPATFIMADLKPGLSMMVQAVEFTSTLGRYLQSRDQYLMGNFPCWRFPFFMPYIDVPGEETTWYSGRQYTPISGRELNYRRAMSGAKPFGFLQATHFERLTRSDVEKYFLDSLFYAFMPSFFSHDGANDPYFVDSAMYERDRPLFRQYLPLTIRLSEALWTPVPSAETAPEAARIEQFGQPRDDVFFLTVRNTSDADTVAVLEPALEYGSRLVYDMFSGILSPVTPEQRRVERALRPNEITALLLIEPNAVPAEAQWQRQWADNHMMYEAAARNLESFTNERRNDLTITIRQHDPTASDEPARWRFVLHNHRADTVTMLEIAGREERREIAPGERLQWDVPMREVKEQGAWMTLGWRIEMDGQAHDMERVLRPRTLDAYVVTMPPPRVQSGEESVRLAYQVESRQSTDGHVTLSWRTEEEYGSVRLDISRETPAHFHLDVEKDGHDVREVHVTFQVGDQVIEDGSTYVIFAAPIQHVGMAPGTRVTASSAFSGYTVAALHNGVVETAGLPWHEAAFATMEAPEAHWIRYEWREPVEVSSVVLHWNREGGTSYCSRLGEIWVAPPDGEARKVAAFRNERPVNQTTVDFEPVMAQSLELRQPSSGGSPERPGLLWLREMEIQ